MSRTYQNPKTRGYNRRAAAARVAQAGGTNLGGNPFTNGSGSFAMEMFKAAADRLPEGSKWKAFTPAVLRTADTLRHEEWKFFDEQLIEEALIRLKGVADLESAGLVRPVSNSMGKTVFAYERVTNLADAQVSMDGVTDTDNDKAEFDMQNLPLPMTHKDFTIPLRTLVASRDRGEPLDNLQVRLAGRRVSEMAEQLLFSGYSGTFGGLNIYGYTTFPSRHEPGFKAHGNWDYSNFVDAGGSKTSQDIFADVQNAIQTLQNDQFFGPYWLYVGTAAGMTLEADYIPNATTQQSTKTIRQRILDNPLIQKVEVIDKMPSGHVVLVNAAIETVCWVKGETLQTIQWDTHGGMVLRFKAFQIGVPLIRADIQGRCGLADLHA